MFTTTNSGFIYVDANATGANNGSNWANAYKYLQDALTSASSGTEIWVAQGTYRPDEDTSNPGGTDDRNATFQLKNNVAIYGGFPTGGGTWESRDPNIYETILSGDIGVADNNSDNSYHVVTGSGTNSTSILDGFTITAGNTTGSYSYGGGMYNSYGSPTVSNCTFSGNSGDSGGGMYNEYSSPTVNNCTFIGNSTNGYYGYGGGMYNGNQSSPTVTNCIFTGNSAGIGGGMCNYSYYSPTLTNCTFAGNSAGEGGGIYNYSYDILRLTNCTFSGNSAATNGGGLDNVSGNTMLTNCTFSGNSAGEGGGIYYAYGYATITNCIFWNNTAPTGAQIQISGGNISYCNIQGGWEGTGNIDSDPLFVDANGPDDIIGTLDDNLRLLPGSPCTDAGDNTAVPVGVVTDLDDLPRFADDPLISDTGNGTPPIVDMGAYEYQPPPLYVDASATGANDGSSWANAYKYLQNALTATLSSNSILVAQGTYRPDENTSNPDGTDDRTATFQLKNDVAIYGGFPTGGGTWESRDPNIYETILSGDIGVADNNSDNSYHVVTGSDINSTSILDGFTITAGNTDGLSTNVTGAGIYDSNGSPTVTNCKFIGNSANGYPNSYGGGMYNGNYSSPTVTNCTFIGNSAYSYYSYSYGGGMYNSNYSSPTVTNCTFIGNSAYLYGGGMCNESYSSPTLTNCTFNGNSGYYGGGMCNYNSSNPMVTNCTFTGNSGYYGGGMCNYNSSNPMVTNCTFTGNSGYYGGGMCNANGSSPSATNCSFSGNSATNNGGGMCNYYYGGNPTVANCIFWSNTAPSGPQIYNVEGSVTVSFSDVQGVWAGTGNINANPLFVDADGPDNIFGTEDDNLRLSDGSPCIDKGNNAGVPADIADLDGNGNTTEPTPLDLDLRPRFVDGDFNGTIVVDMGAYEYELDCPYTSDFDGDCAVDFFDFAKLANSWLQNDPFRDVAPPPAGDGIVDIYDLAILCDNWLAGK
jgi:hypothetical protein